MIRRLLSSALVLALAGSVACGSSRKKVDPDAYGKKGVEDTSKNVHAQALNAILASSKKTVDARSARMKMSMDFGAQLTLTANGIFDFAKGVGSITMDASGLGLGAGALEIRMLGDVMYMRLPASPVLGEGAGKWVRMDLKALSAQAGFDLSKFQSFRQDPTDILNALQGVSGRITNHGKDSVGGVYVIHYEAQVDLRKAIARLGTEKGLDELLEMLGTSTIPIHVWIDEQGLLRKMNYAMDLSKLKTGEQSPLTGALDITMELFDFGAAVSVAAPPAGETLDFQDFLEKAKQQAG